MTSLTGRVAVITGAGSGIGAALAAELGRQGCKLVLADISQAYLDSQLTKLREDGAEATAVVTDVADAQSVESLADAAVSHFSAVDIVCNNAGVLATGPMLNTPREMWNKVMDVNFWGVVNGIRAFASRLIEQGRGGYILNSASLAGLQGVGELGVYSASKCAVVGLSEALYQELKPFGIEVGVLCPMVVRTHLAEHAGNSSGERASDVIDHAPRLKRSSIKTPEFVAAQAVKGILAGRFYIFTHSEGREILRERAERFERACDWLDESAAEEQAASIQTETL